MISTAAAIALILLILACISWGISWGIGASMRRDADTRIVESLDALAPNALVVVLGCPARNRDGTRNRLLDARIASAAAAYHRHAGRTSSGDRAQPSQSSGRLEATTALTLLCSGWDASGEATEMREALIHARVDPGVIDLDGRSARTLDSVRFVARTQPDRPVVFVSQRFHLTRALHLARSLGLDATGLPAAGGLRGLRPRLREALAIPRAHFDGIRSRIGQSSRRAR